MLNLSVSKIFEYFNFKNFPQIKPIYERNPRFRKVTDYEILKAWEMRIFIQKSPKPLSEQY